MSNSLYKTLEFDRVLADLAQRAFCPVASERLLGLTPLSSPELIRKSLGRVSEIGTFIDSGGSMPLDAFDDIRNHLDRASVGGSYLDPQAFRQIHRVLELTANLHAFLGKNQSYFPLLYESAAGLSPAPDPLKGIARAIDLGSLHVRDQASPRLAAIRRQLLRAREQVRRALENLLDRLARKGVLQERLIAMRSGRWVLPVKETHRHLVKGVLHDKSASGATVFLEPLETLELNNQIRRFEAEEQHEIERILRALTDLVRQNLPELRSNFETLVFLDCTHAMALASKAMDEHEPAISLNGVLKIKNGRHPLLIQKKPPLSGAVPLSLSIGEDFNTLVITGPNAGGKTVALKTVGLLSLMVSCGLHIPADADSEIPLFNRIFAHVGDAQSIEMDLSTFSAHIQDIKAIMEEAASRDLVLIDEIGTGTDPQEGSALAMAVLESLTVRGVMTLVTTHQGALKAFAHETPGIANGSMAFDTKTLTPTYRFRPHLPGSSYALEIAKRMGLPEGVITRSQALMGSQAKRLDELILEFEQQIEQNKRLEEALRTERRIAERLSAQFKEEHAGLRHDTKRLRQKAAQEARDIIRHASATVEKAIRTIREKGASKQAISEARILIQKEKDELKKDLDVEILAEKLSGQDQLQDNLRPGDRVYWQRGAAEGIVLDEGDEADRMLIAFDKVKAHVPREELKRAADVDRSPVTRVSGIDVPTPTEVKAEKDTRGMTVEEALSAVDKFLDDAMLAGLKEVQIIHGVGTGALRNHLIPFLSEHPLVEAIRPGGPHQKNPGVTVVEIATK